MEAARHAVSALVRLNREHSLYGVLSRLGSPEPRGELYELSVSQASKLIPDSVANTDTFCFLFDKYCRHQDTTTLPGRILDEVFRTWICKAAQTTGCGASFVKACEIYTRYCHRNRGFRDNLIRWAYELAVRSGNSHLVVKSYETCTRPDRQRVFATACDALFPAEDVRSWRPQALSANFSHRCFLQRLGRCMSCSSFRCDMLNALDRWLLKLCIGRTADNKRPENVFVVVPFTHHAELPNNLPPSVPRTIAEATQWFPDGELRRAITQWCSDVLMRHVMLQWCADNQLFHLTLFLAVLSQQWYLVSQAVFLWPHPQKLSPKLIRDCVIPVIRSDRLASSALVVVALLNRLPPPPVGPSIEFDNEVGEICDLGPLIIQCVRSGLVEWAAVIAVKTGAWHMLDEVLFVFQSPELLRYIIVTACSKWNTFLGSSHLFALWIFLSRFLHRCSSKDAVTLVLRLASSTHRAGFIKFFIRTLDMNLFPSDHTNQPSLLTAVLGGSLRQEDVEEIVCDFVKAGVSAYENVSDFHHNPMRKALETCSLSVVRVLHLSGACSNFLTSRYLSDSHTRSLLKSRGRDDVLSYLSRVPCGPDSLQQLCRLAVTRCVGCFPGRSGRIRTLPVATFIQDYLLFADLQL